MTDHSEILMNRTTLAKPLGGRLSRLASGHVIAPPLVFAVMLGAVWLLNPNYLSPFGISIVAATAAPILLLALGQATVLNVGSIDLSNAATSLLGTILLAMILPGYGFWGILAILALVTVIGAIVAYAQVPSFALTLGTLGVLQTAALVTSDSQTIYLGANRELVSTLYTTNVGFVPLSFWLAVAVALVFWAALQFTRAGQSMTAMGKNETAAILSGVPVRGLRIAAFAVSGFLGGVAGLAILAQAGSASASGIGSALLLPGIAAALVGGASISGGQTNPLNVIFGALTVAFVPMAIQALGVGAQSQSLVYGLFIILVVALTTTRSRGIVIK
ncbi:Ribose transport system permease protein RbsC [Paracoccus haematequi]|uniref:Ribose transport system permease protein RbsC n=2 Tax=Paracoccus haematequi TaxID=2491866 RepID=A0A3S4CIK9_9RHOB|nr:Ribose transport system permease protein RbsC [Paracoccus haematequi]